MILALDIATVVGFAAARAGERPIHGHYRVAEVGAPAGRVFCCFRDWLNHEADLLRPAYVFAEDQFVPANASRDVMRRLLGLRAVCEMVCDERDIRLRWVPVQTVQRFVSGFGRWPRGEKKPAMIRAIERYGWRPQDDNEADALGVFLYAEHQIAPHAAAARSTGSLWARAS